MHTPFSSSLNGRLDALNCRFSAAVDPHDPDDPDDPHDPHDPHGPHGPHGPHDLRASLSPLARCAASA